MNLAEVEASLPPKVYFTEAQRQILEQTQEMTQRIFVAGQEGNHILGGHGRDHWIRVAYLAGNIAAREGIPPFLPVLAGLNHDVGRAINDPRSLNSQHGYLSAETIKDFIDGLKTIGHEEKDLVFMAVEDHPFLNHKVRETEVVKALMDADRVDGMGANMIVRSSLHHHWRACYADFRSEVPVENQPDTIFADIKFVEEWMDMMWTDTGRELARPRLRRMQQFKDEYIQEGLFVDSCARNLGL